MPDLWQVIHEGDVTVHRTEIKSLSHLDVVNFKNGFSVPTDIVIHCIGFEKGYDTFSPPLQEELGLHYDSSVFSKWTVLDAQAEQKVNNELPILKKSPFEALEQRKHTQGPNWHYRCLIVPELAAKGEIHRVSWSHSLCLHTTGSGTPCIVGVCVSERLDESPWEGGNGARGSDLQCMDSQAIY